MVWNFGLDGLSAISSAIETFHIKSFLKFTLDKLLRAYPTFHECYEGKMFDYMDSVIQKR